MNASLRFGGYQAARVVERRVANTGSSGLHLVFTAPLVAWRMLTVLSDAERVMWLVWIWVIAVGCRLWQRRGARRAMA